MLQPKMSFKMKETHWIVLINYMERHPQFARGQFSGPTGKIKQRKMWEELSQQLNSLGYGSKSVEKWQKTWADLKYLIKKKSAVNNKELNKTGGGVGPQIKLTPNEERILAILGKTFFQGVGSAEIGICSNISPNRRPTASSSEVPQLKNEEFESFNIYEIPSSSKNEEVSIEYIYTHEECLLENKSNEGVSYADGKSTETPVVDHNYCEKVAKRKKATNEEIENDLYKETIKELKEIKKGVFTISTNLYEINSTLTEIKKAIFEEKKYK